MDIMFDILLFVLVWLLRCWFFISPIVFIWWFCDAKRRDSFRWDYPRADGIVSWMVNVGSFCCLVKILGGGIESLLTFIPIDLGSVNADGKFVTTRNSISYFFAIILAFFFVVVLDMLESVRNVNRQYLNFMIEKTNEIQNELHSLQDPSIDQDSFISERRETRILNKLYKELKQHVLESNRAECLDDD